MKWFLPPKNIVNSLELEPRPISILKIELHHKNNQAQMIPGRNITKPSKY
jgi:hypothetical protein